MGQKSVSVDNLFAPEAEEPIQETEQPSSLEGAPPESGPPEKLPVPTALPVGLSPEEHADLSHHNEERHDWIEQVGAQDRQPSTRFLRSCSRYKVSSPAAGSGAFLSSGSFPAIHCCTEKTWRGSERGDETKGEQPAAQRKAACRYAFPETRRRTRTGRSFQPAATPPIIPPCCTTSSEAPRSRVTFPRPGGVPEKAEE